MSKGMYLVDADGQGKQKITDFGKGHPSYCSDGSLIYTDWPGFSEGRGYIYLIDPLSGEPRKLCHTPTVDKYRPTTGSCHQHPAWSMDGKSILYNCNQSGTNQIYQVYVN